jgi:tRNA dimethylallyltransferase
MNYNCIIILGPTASGKTKLAVETAKACGGEIISIDSRQVYKMLNVGTGKDMHEYDEISYHLIDIVEPTERYHIFAFANDFYNAFAEIQSRGKIPVLCGGTGLYFDTILKKNKLIAIPVNESLRGQLKHKQVSELVEILNSFEKVRNYRFDTSTHKRLVRAIEIMRYLKQNPNPHVNFHDLRPLIFGIKTTLEQRRSRISQRLVDRIGNGLIEEAEGLLNLGITHDQLLYFGLEYKYLSDLILEKISYSDFLNQLETAIHQYAKRQMTWWRKMEREGFIINWIENFEEVKTHLHFQE